MPRRRPATGGQVTIVSSDKDLMQLIRPGVEMLDPIKQKPIGPAEVMEKFGVTPDKMIDVQALIGDPTDNVPGVPGIGPKSAAQLINEFGDLETRAGRRAGDEAVEAARQPDRACRQGAPLARAGHAADWIRRCRCRSIGCMRRRRTTRRRWRAWLKLQGFRSIATRLGLDGEAAAAPAVETVEAAPRRAQAALPRPRRRPPIADVASGFGPYATITTEAALRAFLAEIATCGFLAIDTETDGSGPDARAARRDFRLRWRRDARLRAAAPRGAGGAGAARRGGRRARAGAERSGRPEDLSRTPSSTCWRCSARASRRQRRSTTRC